MELIVITGVSVLFGGGVSFLTYIVKKERAHLSDSPKTEAVRAAYPALRLIK
ncbi:hypothetical protein [Exiguobacterium flavidum]|uniref:hypothetical protein n=1 Tax=Exiguobacterium flavidum TaxID=2184695 RepID=UPI0013003213|nr:hypothetical protein [Exiguobacterium flavidum]